MQNEKKRDHRRIEFRNLENRLVSCPLAILLSCHQRRRLSSSLLYSYA